MKLALIDGTNVIMRWAFAMMPSGMPDTAAGFPEIKQRILLSCERALFTFVRHVGATHAIVAFDSSLESWRKHLSPEYKATRPNGVTGPWSNRAHMHLTSGNWHCVRSPGNEADDVLATIAHRANERRQVVASTAVHLLSADSDLCQLVRPGVRLWTFGTKGSDRYVEVTAAHICERYGITSPHLLQDYKALVGEKGDNIAGVPGIGPVKAKKILATHGDLASAASANVLKPAELAAALLAYKLLNLSTNCEIESIQPSACVVPHDIPSEAVRA